MFCTEFFSFFSFGLTASYKRNSLCSYIDAKPSIFEKNIDSAKRETSFCKAIDDLLQAFISSFFKFYSMLFFLQQSRNITFSS